MVLHDGIFAHGSGDTAQYGPDYLLDHDVVMVTCNYRLGALGKTVIIYGRNRCTFLLMFGIIHCAESLKNYFYALDSGMIHIELFDFWT